MSVETTSLQKQYGLILEAFLESVDFMDGVISATKAGWGGSGYSVELFESGTWRVLWDNQIGSLYESDGVILGLPKIQDDSDSEMLDEALWAEEDELKAELREKLSDGWY